ncbi:MAG TPA: hypothetical protein VHD87_15270 [Acidimicrobiales bacterium]|nr:hypothetical protein [Acidimicrobiales bacterium]
MTTDDTPSGDSDAPESERSWLDGQWARDAAAYLGGPAPEAPADEPNTATAQPAPSVSPTRHRARIVAGVVVIALLVGVFGVVQPFRPDDNTATAAVSPLPAPKVGPVGEAPPGADVDALRDKARSALADAHQLRCDESKSYGVHVTTVQDRGVLPNFPGRKVVKALVVERFRDKTSERLIEFPPTKKLEDFHPVAYAKPAGKPWYVLSPAASAIQAFNINCPAFNFDDADGGWSYGTSAGTPDAYEVIGTRTVGGEQTTGIAPTGKTTPTFWINGNGKLVMYDGSIRNARGGKPFTVRGFITYSQAAHLPSAPKNAKPAPKGLFPENFGGPGASSSSSTDDASELDDTPTTRGENMGTPAVSTVQSGLRRAADYAYEYSDAAGYPDLQPETFARRFHEFNFVSGTTAITDGNAGTSVKPTIAVFTATDSVRLWGKAGGACWIIETRRSTGDRLYGQHPGDCAANEPAPSATSWAGR